MQERFLIVICSFVNSYDGRFVYSGIKFIGRIIGLEQDMKFKRFLNYDDVFVNRIIDKLKNFLKDRVLI